MSFVEIQQIARPDLQPGMVYSDDQLIDSKERFEWIQSSWKGDRESVRAFFADVCSIFKEKIGIHNDRLFKKVWDQALANHHIEWDPYKPLTVGTFNKIEAALKSTLVFHGPGMEVEGRADDDQVHDIVEFLLGRGSPSSEWVNWKNIKGILLKNDPQLLRAMRDELRVVLQSCGTHLPQPGSAEEVLFKAFIGNIVALLPFSYPLEGEQFVIPQKVGEEWKNVTYTVDKKIELTPKWFSSPIAAYGLTSEEGPPILTFIGTTFPAGDGYVATLLSDFTPGLSVGHAPYLYGKKNLAEWLENKNNVGLYGMSLGGAMTFQVLRHHKERIGQVHAYNPPGLYPWDWNGRGKDFPPVNIYYQENDLVGTMGMFPEGENVTVYRLVREDKENSLKAHARAYSGSENVTILKSDPSYENGRPSRKVLTALHMILGLALAFVPILCAYLLYLLFSAIAWPAQKLAKIT